LRLLNLPLLLALMSLCTVQSACQKRALPNAAPDPATSPLTRGALVFQDDFNRDALGEAYVTTHPGWRLVKGEVNDENAKNKGLWLNQAVPDNARIEFTVRSEALSNGKPFPGDSKCEAFATEPKHQAGYVFINGGWSNRLDVIARLDEHGDDRLAVTSKPVEQSRSYRWAVIRDDNVISWYRDGELLLKYPDKSVIKGGFFGFNNWESNLFFDDLAIYDLDKVKG
jgi:hypothetical protein